MAVIGDLLGRDSRSEALAIRAGSRAGSYTYETLCTEAWKAGNLLAHYNLRAGTTLAVDAGEALSPQPILGVLGASLVGATVEVDPPKRTDAAALLAPVGEIDEYDVGVGTQRLGYGDVPDAASIAHFERELWSENPTLPPESVPPDATVLVDDRTEYTHEQFVEAARRVVEAHGIDDGDEVAIRTRSMTPGVVVAGILAPLVARATIRLHSADSPSAPVAIVGGDESSTAPTIRPGAVL